MPLVALCLRHFLADSIICTCEFDFRQAHQHGRTVATCSVGGADLGDWLVRNGLALDWPQYSKRKYDGAQLEAEHAGRGMWAGSYVEPWLFRVCIRQGGKPSDCSDDANAHP
jgi:endonuclease YncB( thermonuclease family)